MKWPRMRILIVILIILVFVFIVGWALTYPDSSDPKNIKYVFWKAGLYKINLDQAAETMVGDANRDRLVIGKSKKQLRGKFEVLLPPAEASPYLRGCYQSSPWKDREVLFIRRSSWMVVFDGDKATNLVLIKGC